MSETEMFRYSVAQQDVIEAARLLVRKVDDDARHGVSVRYPIQFRWLAIALASYDEIDLEVRGIPIDHGDGTSHVWHGGDC